MEAEPGFSIFYKNKYRGTYLKVILHFIVAVLSAFWINHVTLILMSATFFIKLVFSHVWLSLGLLCCCRHLCNPQTSIFGLGVSCCSSPTARTRLEKNRLEELSAVQNRMFISPPKNIKKSVEKQQPEGNIGQQEFRHANNHLVFCCLQSQR
jgi:hypothetical protein